MVYLNQDVYNYYHDRSFPHSHPPSSPLSFMATTNPFVHLIHLILLCGTIIAMISSYPSEQCPSIGYSLVLGQNQFDTFQGPTNESYPSNFNSEGWNCPQYL